MPVYEVTTWMGIGVPRATPPGIVDRLAREITAALADPAMKARLADAGSAKLELAPSEFEGVMAADTRKWGEVISFAGLKPR